MSLTVDAVCNDLSICKKLSEEMEIPVYAQPFVINFLLQEDPSYYNRSLEEFRINTPDYLSSVYRGFTRYDHLYFVRLRNMMAEQNAPDLSLTIPCIGDLSCRYAIRLSNAIGADADLRARHTYSVVKSHIPMCFQNVICFICNMRLTESQYREVMSVILATHPDDYWTVDTIRDYLVSGPFVGEDINFNNNIVVDFDPSTVSTKSSTSTSRYFIDELASKIEQAGGIYVELDTNFNYDDYKTHGGMGFYQQLMAMGDESYSNPRYVSYEDLGKSIECYLDIVDYIQEAFHVKRASEVIEIIHILLTYCCTDDDINGDAFNRMTFSGSSKRFSNEAL